MKFKLTHYQLVIVTDLDGSLLDHYSYSHAAADDHLRALQLQSIPVVLCTSKTRAEVEALREELGNRQPFIVENGAAIYVPRDCFPNAPAGCERRGEYHVHELCPPVQHWLDLLEEARQRFPGAFDHFSNMTAERVAELTGLTLAQAARARERGYGEPLQWLGDDSLLQEFTEWCEARGARILRGGRFVHVAGRSDKGRALQWLVDQYRRFQPQSRVVSMALGDGHNDVDMLRRADLAVVIRSPTHAPPQVPGNGLVYTTREFGPRGWVEGVDYWFNQLHNNNDLLAQ